MSFKFIESYPANGRKILTPFGYKEIEFVHKTIPYKKYRIKTENGFTLECAENHVIILENNEECYAKNSLNKFVKTEKGSSKIIECIYLGYKECMYDISIKEDTELYYSNGILSHNSGKSITTAIYLTWKFVFDHDKYIGICAYEGGLACEFLKNIKNIFYNLPMWLKVGISTWNNGTIESENKMRILTAGAGADAFRGFTMSIIVVDETAFIDQDAFYEFIDSIAPAQSALAWKKNIFISTANGMNHFYDMVQGAKKKKEYDDLREEDVERIKKKHKVLDIIKNENGYKVIVDEPSNGYVFYEVDWRDVPRFDVKGNKLDPEDFRDQVETKYGKVYFNQNYANQFLGSSYTLIDAEVLKTYKGVDTTKIHDEMLKIYEQPAKNHKYIMGVDPAKGAMDAYAVQILDISGFPFKQVATARVFNCNYQLMPGFIYDWALYYNTALLIIENNEGAGTFCANLLQMEYEYENLYHEKMSNSYKEKDEPGFRTTASSRQQILETFKLFADNYRLVLKDKDTIKELYTFIIKDNKYQADNGYHDDTVMALALCFVPFINNRNFDNMIGFIDKIYSKDNDFDMFDYLSIGNFDDFCDGEDVKTLRSYDSNYFIVDD